MYKVWIYWSVVVAGFKVSLYGMRSGGVLIPSRVLIPLNLHWMDSCETEVRRAALFHYLPFHWWHGRPQRLLSYLSLGRPSLVITTSDRPAGRVAAASRRFGWETLLGWELRYAEWRMSRYQEADMRHWDQGAPGRTEIWQDTRCGAR